MSKFFTTVVSLFILSMSSISFANDDLLALNLKTKEIVRLKLWHDGILPTSGPQQENQLAEKKYLREELSRIIDKVEF